MIKIMGYHREISPTH